jgi:PleD family two-component response regulator
VDLLQSMPDINHFWDRLTMEFRRAAATEKTLSLLLVKAKAGQGTETANEDSAAWGDTAKALSRKLRPTDSIYRLTTDLFALVLPETDPVNAQRVALRLEEELQVVRAKFGSSYEINCYNYPEHVQSAHELEDIVRSLLPEQPGWDIPVPLASN